MKAFKFRLQAVLTLREEKEQEAQRLVAQALGVVATAEAGLARVARDLDGLGREIADRLRTGVAAARLAEFGNYRVLLTERRFRLERELEAAREKVRQARAALLRATQERQALDGYRGRLRRSHDYRMAREEQKFLDDLATRAPVFGSHRSTSPVASSS